MRQVKEAMSFVVRRVIVTTSRYLSGKDCCGTKKVFREHHLKLRYSEPLRNDQGLCDTNTSTDMRAHITYPLSIVTPLHYIHQRTKFNQPTNGADAISQVTLGSPAHPLLADPEAARSPPKVPTKHPQRTAFSTRFCKATPEEWGIPMQSPARACTYEEGGRLYLSLVLRPAIPPLA